MKGNWKKWLRPGGIRGPVKIPPPSKFGNKKTQVMGILFASKKEAERYLELKALQDAGWIKNLQLQERFLLIAATPGEKACSYVADFSYYCQGEKIVEDVKGVKTPVYRIKKKLMLEKFGIKIKEIF